MDTLLTSDLKDKNNLYYTPKNIMDLYLGSLSLYKFSFCDIGNV